MMNQRLYLPSWQYNMSRILSHLAEIVKNNGGRVKPTIYHYIISDRGVSEAIHENQTILNHLEELEKKSSLPVRVDAIAKYKAKLQQLEQINNDPIETDFSTYISFILDDNYYMYEVDSNPFFPFHYLKTPVKNGKYSRDAGLTEASREWMYDCFFFGGCSDADCKEAANMIFNSLCDAKPCKIMRDSQRMRVPNTYDGGYHYEMVCKPENFTAIDF